MGGRVGPQEAQGAARRELPAAIDDLGRPPANLTDEARDVVGILLHLPEAPVRASNVDLEVALHPHDRSNTKREAVLTSDELGTSQNTLDEGIPAFATLEATASQILPTAAGFRSEQTGEGAHKL